MNGEINLMPWREIQRKKENQRIVNCFLLLLMLIFSVCFIINYFIVNSVKEKQNFNHKIKNEIRLFNKKTRKINEIKLKINNLINRIVLLRKLENKKILIMHFFANITKLIPKGVYLKRIKGVKKQISLEGFSESSEAISHLIKNIERNPWMKNPNLIEIKKDALTATKNEFKINFVLSAKEGI